MLTLFFFLQTNPIFVYILGLTSGLNAGKFRSSLYLLFVTIFLLYSFLKDPCFSSKIRLRYSSLFLFLFSSFSLIIHLYRGYDSSFMYFFPLFEFILSYWFFSIIGFDNIYSFFKYRLQSYLAILIPASLFGWIFSVLSGTSFGVFKALVGPVTVNRWPDFITPLLSLVSFIYSPSILLIILLFFASIITLYRTVFIAVLLPLVFYSFTKLLSNHTFSLRLYKVGRFRLILLFSLMFVIYFFLYSPFLSLDVGSSAQVSNIFDLIEAVFRRFLSLFLPEADYEFSGSARVSQLYPLLSEIASTFHKPLNFLLGSNILIDGINPLANYAFYPLTSLLQFGFIIPSFITFLLIKSFVRYSKDSSGIKAQKLPFIYLIISLIVYLILFPYLIQFPIASLVALSIYMLNYSVTDRYPISRVY